MRIVCFHRYLELGAGPADGCKGDVLGNGTQTSPGCRKGKEALWSSEKLNCDDVLTDSPWGLSCPELKQEAGLIYPSNKSKASHLRMRWHCDLNSIIAFLPKSPLTLAVPCQWQSLQDIQAGPFLGDRGAGIKAHPAAESPNAMATSLTNLTQTSILHSFSPSFFT